MSQGRELLTHRLTVRLPGRVFEAMKRVAEEDRRTVSNWIVKTLERAVAVRDDDPIVRWRRGGGTVDKRLTLRIKRSLYVKLIAAAEIDKCGLAEWVTIMLERALARNSSQWF